MVFKYYSCNKINKNIKFKLPATTKFEFSMNSNHLTINGLMVSKANYIMRLINKISKFWI